MADLFITPMKIISGSNALEDAADTIQTMGSKALIITDQVMCSLGNLEKVTDLLDSRNVKYVVDSSINSEPDDSMIIESCSVFQKEQCDFLIGLGGGSPLDAMKAVGILVSGGGRVTDYIGRDVTWKLSPMVAIPTTAGTGSEATQFTIITDKKTQVKMLLKGVSLVPDLAVIDPLFTITVPEPVTASTGVDALTHAIEAYTSKKAQPLSDTLAVSACQRIFKNLKLVYEDGKNVEGRIQMSLAALEAGMAFNNASVTIIHGMSRPIGAMFHVPHGISNAMLLCTCLDYIADGAIGRLAELSRQCGFASGLADDEAAVLALQIQVKQLLKDIQIPSLKAFGIDKTHFFKEIPKMARDAEESGSPANTRKHITLEAMEMLYKRLWE